jgi:hypothetical protein
MLLIMFCLNLKECHLPTYITDQDQIGYIYIYIYIYKTLCFRCLTKQKSQYKNLQSQSGRMLTSSRNNLLNNCKIRLNCERLNAVRVVHVVLFHVFML